MSISFKDTALAKAIPSNFASFIRRGARGNQVVAVQYALGRLGYLDDLCDGSFGPITERAVRAFQSDISGIAETGVINVDTLKALDNAVSREDFRVPAVKSGDPMAYLSDFRARGLPVVYVEGSEENLTWDHAVIQAAYGRFVADYWEVMKANRVEGDCKNIALFLMDQFRKQLKQDTLVDLPHPALGVNEDEKTWIVATADKTTGLFSHLDKLRVGRYDYPAMKKVQNLDKNHSMIYGVNVHYPEISTDRVAKSTRRIFDWEPAYENYGDTSKPEVPVNQLAPGDMIFIDHTGNGSYDHTVNVIKVTRDSNNRVRQLTLGMGSYDDMRDNSSATIVTYNALNPYSEEVIVDLDSNGLITGSRVSYSSEPTYLVKTRYRAVTSLMERKPGGKLMVCRWS
ncbi:peptidoglycan-binding protein [Leucothrix pacifica]|uniref:peptidoglycan-binding protein n=1 Tax=Leucothrix pacifica TaxID=1247513 RepID=UPI001FE88EB9|nr:peptidoglycan-binding protein [Leucothrix pacifica]